MKKLFTIMLLFAFTFAGCQSVAHTEESTTKPSFTSPTIPDAESELEKQFDFGSEILSATLKYKESEINISPDDPRLIRLMNLLLYSEDQNLTWMIQGAILDDEIQQRLAATEPATLDIALQLGENPSGFLGNATRIVICKDEYMIINDKSLVYEGLVAEQFYPFVGLQSSKFEDYPDCDWGQDDWIDLLEIVDFVNADGQPVD